MANKGVFASTRGQLLPNTDIKNEAGGTAYDQGSEHGLAQLAATGCFGNTFYATAEAQLEKVLKLADGCSSDFVARTAVYARRQAFMKDMPALLCAVLAARKDPLLNLAFPLVMDNARMLRNFVQIVRSGVTGRKSMGSAPRRLVRGWLTGRKFDRLFRDSVGQDPSIADVIKMVHPKPASKMQAALFAYLIGKNENVWAEGLDVLPDLVRDFEAYKAYSHRVGEDRIDIEVPDVPFQMLTSLKLGKKEWTDIANRAPWQMTRMNLNTFKRHGVFEDPKMIQVVARRLASPELVRRARCFPYQLFMAYHAVKDVPHDISEALQDALDASLENIPSTTGQIYVFPDVSGSMQSPVTGARKGSTTRVTCQMVAALVASAILRANPKTVVIPFDQRAHNVRLNPRDSVMTNTEILARFNGGATNLAAPLDLLNAQGLTGDLCVYVSDNQSWVESNGRYPGYRYQSLQGLNQPTGTMRAWEHFKRKSPQAKMVCIDINPYASTQAKERDDIFNVGGFSDSVFRFLDAVAKGQASKGFWVDQIKAVELTSVHEKEPS
ncbi:MAG: TROVE domain-containing protein [Gemmatimonadetes bacterium]|nr:TROVE domain-containing protein [Gemmatimonadota bacterium]